MLSFDFILVVNFFFVFTITIESHMKVSQNPPTGMTDGGNGISTDPRMSARLGDASIGSNGAVESNHLLDHYAFGGRGAIVNRGIGTILGRVGFFSSGARVLALAGLLLQVGI
jgi:hypothetical protein